MEALPDDGSTPAERAEGSASRGLEHIGAALVLANPDCQVILVLDDGVPDPATVLLGEVGTIGDDADIEVGEHLHEPDGEPARDQLALTVAWWHLADDALLAPHRGVHQVLGEQVEVLGRLVLAPTQFRREVDRTRQRIDALPLFGAELVQIECTH